MKQFIIFLGVSLLFFTVAIEANLFPVVNRTSTCSSKSPCQLKWVEDGIAPKLVELPNVEIKLMTGPNDNQIQVMDLGTHPPTIGKIIYNISPSLGPPGRFYFYKFNAGTSEVWSGRFIIQDIQGKIPGFDPSSINAKGDIVSNSTQPPPTEAKSASSMLSANTVAVMGLSMSAMAISYLC